MNATRRFLPIIVIILFIAACSSGGGGGGGNTATPVTAQVTLRDAVLPVDAQIPLPVTVTGIDVSRTDLTWTSSDPTSATIDDQGDLTTIAPGDTTVTATLKSDTRVKDTATIAVVAVPSSAALAIEEPGDSTLLMDGESQTVSPTTLDDTLIYTLSNGTITLQTRTANQATVPVLRRQPTLYLPSNGTIAITLNELAAGTTVTALMGNANHVLAMSTANADGAIEIEAHTPTDLAHGTQPLIFLVAAPTSTVASTPQSKETNVATSTSTTAVTILALGVQVTDPSTPEVHAIEISQSDMQLTVGQTLTLTPRLVSTGDPDADSTWTSSSPTTATIDGLGTIETLAPGETVITVQSVVNPSATDTITIRVVPGAPDVTSSTVTVSPSTVTADGTSTATITVQLKDENSNDLTESRGDVITIDTPSLGSVGTVSDNGDGSYSATYTVGTTSGTDTIQAKLNGANITNTATITVTPVEAPVISGPSGGPGASSSSITVEENQTTVFTMSVSEAVTWSKAGGADAAQFSLDVSSGELTFVSAPNFEVPQDDNVDNTYTLVVRATGALGASSEQTVHVTVSDVDEFVYAVSFTTGELIRFEPDDPADTRTTLLAGGSLVSPASIAMGPDGNLYIGENGDGSTFAPRISKFEPDTLTLSTVYPFSAFEVFPASLAFQGNDLLIGRNPEFSDTGPIVKLTNATGGPLAVSDYTSGTSLASSPGIALDSDGQLYVSDQTYDFDTSIASGPVQRFDVDGSYVGEVIADGASGLAAPDGMAIDGNILYVSSYMSGTVLKMDLTTGDTSTFFDAGSPNEAGVLEVLSNGELLVGSETGKIYHVDANGTLVATFASGLGHVGGLAASD